MGGPGALGSQQSQEHAWKQCSFSPYLAQGLQVCGRCRESPGLCSVALRRLPPQAALPPPLPPLACAVGLTQVSWECSGETGLLSLVCGGRPREVERRPGLPTPPLVVTSAAWEKASPASERVGVGGQEERTSSGLMCRGRPQREATDDRPQTYQPPAGGRAWPPGEERMLQDPGRSLGSPLPTPSTAVTGCDGSRSSHSPTTRATSPFPTAISIF